MDEVIVRKVDEVYLKVDCEASIRMELSDHFTFKVPGCEFMPSYRNKMWDGRIRLFNYMTGKVYVGLMSQIIEFCRSRGYKPVIDSELKPIEQVDDDYGTTLAKNIGCPLTPRYYQNDALVHCLNKERALILSPTASGKSLILYLLAQHHLMRDNRILIIVPTISLVHQMASDFNEYGNKEPIHKIQGGVEKNSDARIVISTWQSIHKQHPSWFNEFNVVMGDECHLFKAKSLSGLMEKTTKSRYKYGFTGTLDDSLTHKLVLEGLFGQVKRVVDTKTLIDNEDLSPFRIKCLILQYPNENRKELVKKTYQEEIDWLIANPDRNGVIVKLALSLKGNTLILFQFVEKHGDVLQSMLQDKGKDLHYIHGGVDVEIREATRAVAESSTNNILLCSYGTFSTGINIKRLDNIIFASPYKSKIRNLQSIGRVLRKSDHKDMATLYDISDDLKWKNHTNFSAKHFESRISIYREEKFPITMYPIKVK